MGFYSKVCSKTFKPVVHQGRGFPALCEVVALFPDGRTIRGAYDGYGRVGGEEICPGGYDEKTWKACRFVLAKYYEGEGYKDVKPSRDERAQGHFMSDGFLYYCLSTEFKTYADYSRAFKKLGGW